MSDNFGPCGQINVNGFLPKLNTDLDFPSSIENAGYKEVNGIDCSTGLTTVLSLTGKHMISLLYLGSMTAENVTIKLTVDGEIKWNDSFALSTTSLSLVGTNFTSSSTTDFFGCESSLLLEVQTATDTSIDLRYMSRPLL